jgi:DNA-binding NtrC family response regulator
MRRILIVDDEPSVLRALHRALRLVFPPEGLLIEAFVEPEAALLRAGEQDFDVVITDFRMPGLSGADVLQVMKALQPDAVRIVLSATTEREDIIAVVNRAGVFRYLAKPWRLPELAAALREAFAYRDACLQVRAWRGEASPVPAPGVRELELQRLEREEPGITRVDCDENGDVRLS